MGESSCVYILLGGMSRLDVKNIRNLILKIFRLNS